GADRGSGWVGDGGRQGHDSPFGRSAAGIDRVGAKTLADFFGGKVGNIWDGAKCRGCRTCLERGAIAIDLELHKIVGRQALIGASISRYFARGGLSDVAGGLFELHVDLVNERGTHQHNDERTGNSKG